MAKILDVWQPVVGSLDANGDPGDAALMEGLMVKLDKDDNGRLITTIPLMFTDYTGLESEWGAQTVYTILDAAVDSIIDDVEFPVDQMATPQRGVLDVEFTIT